MYGSPSSASESQTTPYPGRKRGGWITFPFITAGVVGVTVAGGGCLSNMMVYLMEEFGVRSMGAAKIMNAFLGISSLVPVAGAAAADSFLGCFSVICISSFLSLLGAVLLTLTTTLNSLRPHYHGQKGPSSSMVHTKLRLIVLYAGIALNSIGVGGMRFTIATMGANQFNEAKDRGVFFNWYLIILYASIVLGGTIIVYIEDNVGWAWGFGICTVFNGIGLVIFMLGNRCYSHVKPQGSPFTSLVQVVVAAVRKRKLLVSSKAEDYYHGRHHDTQHPVQLPLSMPSQSFGFLNCAALKTPGDLEPNGVVERPWRLCSVQQIEDLKTLVRIFPLWSTGIILSGPSRFLNTLIILQALSMDRRVGFGSAPVFQIPAGTMPVFLLAATALSLAAVDRVLARRPLPVLRRIAMGHALSVAGMAVAAAVEARRLELVRHRRGRIPALWLLAPMAVVGAGEAFHYPGQVALYYQEFPAALRSTATAMVAIHMGVAYYLSTAVIEAVRRLTLWLPDDIDDGRLDNVYWVLTLVGAVNFGYYLLCARFYRLRNGAASSDTDSTR